MPLGLPPWCGSPALCVDHAARRTRWRSRSKLARPYICRLISLSRVIWPSAWPLLQGVVSAARIAAPSCSSPAAKVSRARTPDLRASASQVSNATRAASRSTFGLTPHPRTRAVNRRASPATCAALSSNSVVGQRMAVSLGVELSNRFVDGAVEVIRTVERLMSEVMPLQVAPETLDVVQLRSIVRQPLDGEPVGALGERGAACLAGVDRAVVEDEHDRLEHAAELGPIAPIDLLQESDEVRASFGPAGVNNELALRPVEHPEHRHFRRLARRRNAQIGPSLGP